VQAEIKDIVKIGYLNGLFVLARSIGLIGHALDQKRLQQPLYRHPWDAVTPPPSPPSDKSPNTLQNSRVEQSHSSQIKGSTAGYVVYPIKRHDLGLAKYIHTRTSTNFQMLEVMRDRGQ